VCDDGVIRLQDLPEAVTDSPVAAEPVRAPVRQKQPALSGDGEAVCLHETLQAAHWNVSAVARALGCSRMTLYRRMKRLGVESPLRA
jgi:transcriptional regulator of acetoin/glycerol metabolism